MANTGIKFGTTCIDGEEEAMPQAKWINPTYFCNDDNLYAELARVPSPVSKSWDDFETVQLIIDGTPVGNNYATGSLVSEEVYHSFGGESDKWGLDLTPSQVNSSNFGIKLKMRLPAPFSLQASNSLSLTGFTMGLLTRETILGIKVEIKGYVSSFLGVAALNCARITVYYNYGTYYNRLLMPRHLPWSEPT
jgi:hypothetical protein